MSTQKVEKQAICKEKSLENHKVFGVLSSLQITESINMTIFQRKHIFLFVLFSSLSMLLCYKKVNKDSCILKNLSMQNILKYQIRKN